MAISIARARDGEVIGLTYPHNEIIPKALWYSAPCYCGVETPLKFTDCPLGEIFICPAGSRNMMVNFIFS